MCVGLTVGTGVVFDVKFDVVRRLPAVESRGARVVASRRESSYEPRFHEELF